jgi:hypothetical protein
LLYSTILALTLVASGAALYGQEKRFLIHSSVVRNEGLVVGVVQLARSLADRDRSLRVPGTVLTVGGAVTGSTLAVLLPAAQSPQGLPPI